MRTCSVRVRFFAVATAALRGSVVSGHLPRPWDVRLASISSERGRIPVGQRIKYQLLGGRTV